jgi:flagella basal body P-ring formation protein FlgA
LLTLAAGACDIVLKNNVEIPSDSIYLKNITTKCPQKVKNLFIADSPYINNPLTIAKPYIEAILKRMHFHYSICGTKVKILRKTFLVTKKTILKLLGKKNIKILSKMPIVLPYDNYAIKIKKVINNREFIYIELAVYKNGQFFRYLGISAKRKITSVFPVAKFDIRRGEIITANKIKFAKIPSTLQNAALRSIQAIIGKIAITDIRQNQPFTSSNTKREELVKMGDLVKVDVIDGSIKISTIAKALRSGFKNDIIPIMYLNSKRVAVATIVGKKEVRIQ